MRRLLLGIVPLLVVVPALRADDKPKEKPKEEKPATPAEQFKALFGEVRKAQQEARTKFQEAKTDEDRQKVQDDFSKKLHGFAGRFLEFAKGNPKAKESLTAIALVLNIAPDSPEAGKAIDLLIKDHLNNPELGPLSLTLASQGSPAAEKVCRAVLDKSKDKKAQAFACLGLAQLAKGKAENPGVKPAEAAKLNKEAEDLYDRVVKDYADVKQAVKIAEKELFPIRHLVIGKEAPEIEGEDGDGKKFKLSDYKGKVVVLDFWAGW
jgi:hypothetical protein